MPDNEPSLDFECPSCQGLVNPDWKACPSCGVEFLPQEDEGAPSAEAAPAADEAALVPSEPAEAPPASVSTAAAPKDDLEELNLEITGELDKVDAAPTASPPAKSFAKSSGKSSAKARGRSAARSSAKSRSKTADDEPAEPKAFAKAGGPIGFIGLMMAVGGALGAIVVGNWDTLVRGAANNYIGPLQIIAVVGAIVLAGAGVIVLYLGTTRAKRGAGAA